MRAILLVNDLAHLLEILTLPLGDGLRLLRFQQPPESARPSGLPQRGPFGPHVLEVPAAHRLAQGC